MIPLRSSARRAPPGADDVVARLADCHVRIRRFAAEACALARVEGAHADPRAQASARAVREYFARALPLHAEDEDASIGPRLRNEGGRAEGELGEILGALAADHARSDELTALLVPVWDAIARGEPAQLDEGAHRALVDELASLLERHLEVEERAIFPAVARLESAERVEIVAEMRARRDVAR